jgi:Ca-activated chloride channel family protein
MKNILWAFTFVLISFATHATQWIDVEKSDSPYFLVKGGSAGDLLLENTDVAVNINGVIANVVVTQIYKHTGNNTLDANYLFPASNRAAVHGMTLTVNDRKIEAKIERKEAAKAKYKQALSEGKTAALVEQIKPNLFSFSAGNILAGDEIKVELRYTEYLASYKGVYDFYFPTIVGPRYGALDTHATVKHSISTDIKITARTGAEIFEPTVNWSSKIESLGTHVNIMAKQIDSKVDGREDSKEDFKFSFRLTNEEFNTSFITYEDDGEKYFLTMLNPPKRYSQNDIMPQDYIFVMDVSGSMRGRPLELSKELMTKLLHNMRAEDRFNVVQFAGGSFSLFDKNEKISDSKIESALAFIEQPKGGGGTEVLPALERAFKLVENDERSYNVVLITDGLVTVEREVFDLVRKNRAKTNVFAFGTGVYGDNKYMFDGIANAAGTVPFIVMDEQIDKYISEFSEYLSTPLLTQVKVDFNGLDVFDVFPEQTQDIFSQRPLVITGKYRGSLPQSIGFSGNTTNGEWVGKVIIDEENSKANNEIQDESVKYLWAREKIRLLDDYQQVKSTKETEEAVTLLGMKYNLMTRYTSFIAIDDVVRAASRDESENFIITGSRIASGAAGDDIDFEPVRLSFANKSENENKSESENKIAKTKPKYWNVDSNKWTQTCDVSNQLIVGSLSKQWLLISQKLPENFTFKDQLCTSSAIILVKQGSTKSIGVKMWKIIESYFVV